jgi:hypothetical protein
MGMAYVEKRYNEPEAEIGIIPLPHGQERPAKMMRELERGDRLSLPVWAVVMPRMPDEDEKAAWAQRLE